MDIEEMIKDFLITGKMIYKASTMCEECDGEIPDSITLSATDSVGKIIEITIAYKDSDD